jgi:hypothetical protein
MMSLEVVNIASHRFLGRARSPPWQLQDRRPHGNCQIGTGGGRAEWHDMIDASQGLDAIRPNGMLLSCAGGFCKN